MPGLTAWVGLLKIAMLKLGDVVFVSRVQQSDRSYARSLAQEPRVSRVGGRCGQVCLSQTHRCRPRHRLQATGI